MSFERLTPKQGHASQVTFTARCVAKGIDFGIVFLLFVIIPYPFGVFMGFAYALLHDAILHGQSPGKKLMGLVAVEIKNNAQCTFRDSAIRNSPLGVVTFFVIIPFWGWFLLVLLGLPLGALELYLMFSSHSGYRLGDIMADTHVILSPDGPFRFKKRK